MLHFLSIHINIIIVIVIYGRENIVRKFHIAYRTSVMWTPSAIPGLYIEVLLLFPKDKDGDDCHVISVLTRNLILEEVCELHFFWPWLVLCWLSVQLLCAGSKFQNLEMPLCENRGLVCVHHNLPQPMGKPRALGATFFFSCDFLSFYILCNKMNHLSRSIMINFI